MFCTLSTPLALSALLSMAAALELPPYATMATDQQQLGVLEVTFNNTKSGINLYSGVMQDELTDLVQRLQSDNSTKAVVFKSAKPEYFIAHADLNDPAFSGDGATRGAQLFFDITNLPQATIGAVNGIARGGGNEFLAALDMRFATKTLSKFGQLEVGIGLIPGFGGAQYLSRLIGRGLAMEYILTSNDIDAVEAERIGWINKAFETVDDMDVYIRKLTARLAVFPLKSISAGKQAVNVATRPTLDNVLDDATEFTRLFSSPEEQAFLQGTATPSNQSDVDSERFLGDNIPLLYPAFVPVGNLSRKSIITRGHKI